MQLGTKNNSPLRKQFWALLTQFRMPGMTHDVIGLPGMRHNQRGFAQLLLAAEDGRSVWGKAESSVPKIEGTRIARNYEIILR